MADFGELRDFLDPATLTFTLAGEKFEVNPPVEEVLAVLAGIEHTDTLSRVDAWRLASRLVDIKFDEKTGQLSGDLYDKLVAAGATATDIDRILQTIVVFFWLGEESARNFYTGGSILKKADEATPSTPTTD